MELLADNSEALFGMKCTLDTIFKYKFYTPLAYSKPASVLAPLAGGKVVSSTVVEDEHGHHLDHTGITAGSKVRLILSLNSLYFSAQTKCPIGKIKVCSGCFQGPYEKCCIGQDEGQSKGRQEGRQEAPCQTSQACKRHSQAQGSSLLHTPLPQVRHVDVENDVQLHAQQIQGKCLFKWR
jgi:hypothetical protein